MGWTGDRVSDSTRACDRAVARSGRVSLTPRVVCLPPDPNNLVGRRYKIQRTHDADAPPPSLHRYTMGPIVNNSASQMRSPTRTTDDIGSATLSAASRALAIDHITDLVCAALDTPSLLSALRVNYAFFQSAGKALYRHLYLGCGAPLSGALVGNDTARRAMLNAYHPCEGQTWDEAFCLWKLSTISTAPERPVKGKGKPGKKAGVAAASPAVAEMKAALIAARLPPLPDKEIKSFIAHLVDRTIGALHSGPGRKRKTRNFKLQLLRYVRVLTVTSHHRCVCALWGAHVASFFPNVEVLRVVPNVSADGALIPACDGADVKPCPFLQVNAQKLVLRNLDRRGPPIPGHLSWSSPNLERVSLYLPLDGAECSLIPPPSLKGQFPGVKEINVVFHVWHGARVVDVLFPTKNPHLPDALLELLHSLTIPGRSANTKIKIHGIDTIALDLLGSFVVRADALMDTTAIDPAFSMPSAAEAQTLVSSLIGYVPLSYLSPEDEAFAKFVMDALRCDAATGFIRQLWHPGKGSPNAAEIKAAMRPNSNVSFGTLEEYFESKECEEDEQLKSRGIACTCKSCERC